MALADNVDDAVRLTSNYLQWRYVAKLSLSTATPCEPGSPAEAALLKRLKSTHHEEMVAKRAAVTALKALPEELERAGFDSTCVLRLLQFIDGGGGPDRAYGEWTETKTYLQRAAIRIRTLSEPNNHAWKRRRESASRPDQKETCNTVNPREEEICRAMAYNRQNPPEWKRELLRQIDDMARQPGVLAMFRGHIRNVAKTLHDAPRDEDGLNWKDFFGPGPALTFSEKFYLLAAFHDVFAEAERMTPIMEWEIERTEEGVPKPNDEWGYFVRYYAYGGKCADLSEEELQPAILRRYVMEVGTDCRWKTAEAQLRNVGAAIANSQRDYEAKLQRVSEAIQSVGPAIPGRRAKLRGNPGEGMSWHTADAMIRKHLERHAKDHIVTVGELVSEIGCSRGTVSKCPTWQTYMTARKAARQPRAVGMTDKTLNREDTATEDPDRDDEIDKSSDGPKSEQLARLMAESDSENNLDPSPLARNVKRSKFTPRRKP